MKSVCKALLFYPKLFYLAYKFLVQTSKSKNTQLQSPDETNPLTWEFSCYSQNGEDGIINFLINKLNISNKYFIEIGSGFGIENNTTFLAMYRRFSGLMIEGDKYSSKYCRYFLKSFCLGVDCINFFVDDQSIEKLKQEILYNDPDVFSLDIDGNDYFLVKTIFNAGIRPKIFVVEYNSCYGPTEKLTIVYDKYFNFNNADESNLYYGASISAWISLFEQNDYSFVTVDSNGVNAFFIDKHQFNESFYKNINGLKFRENFYQYKKLKKRWEEQFSIIKNKPFTNL